MNNIMQIIKEEINTIKDGAYKDLLALNQTQTAKALNISSSTLQKWREQGTGPGYKKMGEANTKSRVLYPKWCIASYLADDIVKTA